MHRLTPRFALAIGLFALSGACAPTQGSPDPTDGAPAAVAGVTDSPAAGLPTASPQEVGMSAEGLARIGPAMEAYVDDGRLPGIVTMVARRGHVVHWSALGFRDLEAGDPLAPDDILRIFSMTKPITSVAVMMLAEEGLISLDDPISAHIPAFGRSEVLTDEGERVAVERPITVEHLLTHTSGLTYGFFGDTPVDRLYREANFFGEAQGLDDFATRAGQMPLLAHPGEVWNYGVSTDLLGRLVEVVSGQPFDSFVRGRITDPLGMEDTAFFVTPEKRDRFMANYALIGDALQVTDSPVDGRFTREPLWLSGGGGLTSTPSDYIRFAQMLLQDGELDGVRLLQAETVQNMRRNHLPEGLTPISLGTFLSPGYGFGLGFALLVDADNTPEPDTNGVFRWAGAANTFFWIDPEEELVGMVWTQVNPFGLYPIEREFQTLVYDAIEN